MPFTTDHLDAKLEVRIPKARAAASQARLGIIFLCLRPSTGPAFGYRASAGRRQFGFRISS